MPAVVARGVTVRYGRDAVLRQLDLDVGRGSCLALWGANGAGKTTAIRALIGLVPSDGEIVIAGTNLRKDPRALRRQVGHVAQRPGLYPDMTAGGLLRYLAALRGLAEDVAASRLAASGLAPMSHKRVGTLSGGMQRRLALAGALLGDPPVLLLDEPSAGLDRSSRVAFLTELASLRAEGKTIVLASHREDEVAALADGILEIRAGHPGEPQAVDAWLASQRAPVTIRLAVPAELIPRAEGALAHHGFTVRGNSHGLEVEVAAGRRAEPLGVLARAGIRIAPGSDGPRDGG
ncbi:MAG: ABC transporter ATP-binding protein [Anaerolineae bacterium]